MHFIDEDQGSKSIEMFKLADRKFMFYLKPGHYHIYSKLLYKKEHFYRLLHIYMMIHHLFRIEDLSKIIVDLIKFDNELITIISECCNERWIKF